MIRILTGDMWAAEADVRINTVNCVGIMGKGVALEFAKRYPDLVPEYRYACAAKSLEPGGIYVWKRPNLEVWNVATKLDWRNPSKYDWVYRAIDRMEVLLSQHQGRALTVTVPALGCGNGGLNWDKVSMRIVDKLGHTHHNLYVFNPPGYNYAVQIP